MLVAAGVQGMSATSLASSIIAAAVFVLALVLARVLGDYSGCHTVVTGCG